MKSKSLIFVLLIVLLLSSCTSKAEFPRTTKDAAYLIANDDGMIYYGEYYASCPRKIMIPSSFDGKTITQVNTGNVMLSSFGGLKNVEQIEIEPGIEYIADMSFRNCPKLEKIILPASLTYIGHSLFIHCDNLKEICYRGSEVQWNKLIEDSNQWNDFEGINIVFNYQGN